MFWVGEMKDDQEDIGEMITVSGWDLGSMVQQAPLKPQQHDALQILYYYYFFNPR